MDAVGSAGIVTVYRADDDRIHHTRCGERISLRGRLGSVGPEMELDFYCLACVESVTLPACVLARIPTTARSAVT